MYNHASSNQFHPDDFTKTVLSWTFETVQNPLGIAVRQPALPLRVQSVAQYYSNFLPFILEEARAIIASGLEKVDQFEQLSKKNKKNKEFSHLSDAKPFNLVLQKKARLPKNEGNPLTMTFRGKIPDKIEHGKSMNVVLLRTKNITPEKRFLALATENLNATELMIKIIISSSDFYAYETCFEEGDEWQAHYLGSVISEQRMYDTCLEATDIPCVQQIARGQMIRPNVARNTVRSSDTANLNLSQREAICAFFNARTDSTLLLQGPPGTGKTTTLVSLLKQVAASGKRTLVCAHSNKGVQVLALRAMKDIPEVRMILVGVESKLPDELRSMFLNRWYENIASYFSAHNNEIESLSQGRFDEASASRSKILSEISESLLSAQKALNTFMLVDSRQLSAERKQVLYKLTNDPVSIGDFQNIQTHIQNTQQQLQSKKPWSALLSALNRLIDKWSRINKEDLESYLLDTAEIVFATLVTSGRKGMLNMAPIDCLLVDEAAQSVEAATLIPMRYQPRKVILVGDTKQLPATVISRMLDGSSRSSPKNYQWSMMWRLIEELKQPSLMLTIQYRMHPHICQWPSGQYYEDCLITSPAILPMPLLHHADITSRPYAIYQISGHVENHEGSNSLSNLVEANYVVQIIEHIRKSNKTSSIGVITPYAAQRHVINQNITKKKQAVQIDVDVNTVDGFQGDERDIIIISFVRTHVSEFLKEFRRLNVAITRAKSCLIILGAPTLLLSDIGQMMKDAQLRGVLYTEQELKNILASGAAPIISHSSSSSSSGFQSSAWRHHPQDQFNYAKSIEHSEPALAFLWHRRAAENNHSESQYYISHIYLSGNAFIRKDTHLGIRWLDKSARQGVALAQYALGRHFISGEIIIKNIDAGIEYCKKAANQGVVEAILYLAHYYDYDKQDRKQAENYYRRAAKLGCLPEALRLADLLASGSSENQCEAIKWYRVVAGEGVVSAYYPLAKLLTEALQNHVEALTWFIRAAENGHVDTQYELGLRFQHGDQYCSVDLVKSAVFFRLAAVAGHVLGQFMFAMCLKDGRGVEQHEAEAMQYFKKSADQAHIESQYQFGLLQFKFDKYKAYTYFLEAALQKHALAQFECVKYQVQFNRDLTHCLNFCEQLARTDHLQAQFILARLLDTGIAGRIDKASAYRYYLPFANNGNLMAQYRCAFLLESGVVTAQDLGSVHQYYESSHAHFSYAKLRLACLLLKENAFQQTRQAVPVMQNVGFSCLPSYKNTAFFYKKNTNSTLNDAQKRAVELLEDYYQHYKSDVPVFSNAIEQDLENLISRYSECNSLYVLPNVDTSSTQANYLLGKIVHEGKGVKMDISRALHHYEVASPGYSDASYRMGYIYESGQGVCKSWSSAKVLYQQAADRGHELAAKRLTWSYSMFAWGGVPDDETLRSAEASQCMIM